MLELGNVSDAASFPEGKLFVDLRCDLCLPTRADAVRKMQSAADTWFAAKEMEHCSRTSLL